MLIQLEFFDLHSSHRSNHNKNCFNETISISHKFCFIQFAIVFAPTLMTHAINVEFKLLANEQKIGIQI